VRKFREILHYYLVYLSEFQKLVISRRSPCQLNRKKNSTVEISVCKKYAWYFVNIVSILYQNWKWYRSIAWCQAECRPRIVRCIHSHSRPISLFWHLRLVTCEASRYSNLNRMILIRFKSDRPIRSFRISRICRHTTNHVHCSTKKTSTIVPL